MPHYSQTYSALKDQVAKCNFNSEQLTVINRLMRGCWKLRSGDLCSQALQYALPDDFEVVPNTNIVYKDFKGNERHPLIVKRKDEPLPEPSELDQKLKEALETGEIS